MQTQSRLETLLHDLGTGMPGVRAALLITQDGLLIAGGQSTREEVEIAALAAEAFGSIQRGFELSNLGPVDEAVVQGKDGCLLVQRAGDLALLAISASHRTLVSALRRRSQLAAPRIEGLLDLSL